MSLRVIVCGGRRFGELTEHLPLCDQETDRVRAYREVAALYQALNTLHDRHGIETIIDGGCLTGADRHARAWAARREIDNVNYPADWRQDGKKAGPRRNTRMVADSEADVVVATPGGKGTADCVRKAVRAGLIVITVNVAAQGILA